MIVAVTGAGGFIGSRVVHLLQMGCSEVRGLYRRREMAPTAAGGKAVKVVLGDVTDQSTLERLVRGTQGVVHCAARTSEGRSDERVSYTVNVEGTRRLTEVCREAECQRLIHLSSQSAHAGNATFYGKSKWVSEQIVRDSGLEVTILRPSLVYGPGTKGLFAKLVGLVRSLPFFPVVGSGEQRFRPVHVDDVAAAVWACLRKPSTIGKAYELGGAQTVTFNAFMDAVASGLGKRVLKCHIPVWACVALAKTSALVMERPPLTLDTITGFLQMRACDNAPAEADFGYHPKELEEGLRVSLGGVR